MGHHHRTQYRFIGMAEELAGTCPLDSDEVVFGEGRCRVRRSWRYPLGYYRSSDRRISILTHFGFRPDQIVEVARSEIVRINAPDPRSTVRLECADSKAIWVRPFSWSEIVTGAGRIPVRHGQPGAAEEMFRSLKGIP
jgi:hypothetical protein